MRSPRHVLTIVAVRDLPVATRFYDGAFGWTKVVNEEVYVEYALPGGQRVGLYDRIPFGRNTGKVPGMVADGELAPTELYLHVDDPEAAMRSLTGAGARPLSGLAPRAWGDAAAYFADPDGNVIVVARPLGLTRAAGTFSVERTAHEPLPGAEGVAIARTRIAKTFEGDLAGTSVVEMTGALSSHEGSAAYVAIERVEGKLLGRDGAFVLQHAATMDRGAPSQAITVVPDSGSGGLRGLSGSMRIEIVDGQHRYEFDFAIA